MQTKTITTIFKGTKRNLFALSLALGLFSFRANAQFELMGVNNWGGNGIGGNIYTVTYNGTGYSSVSDFVVDYPGFSSANVQLCNAPNGKMYGTTTNDGLYHYGVIFSYDPSANTYTVLHHFNTPDGTSPNAGLILASNGRYYGLATGGGANNVGTIFMYNDTTNTFTKLYDFVTATGSFPRGRLMQASNGILYGMTSQGGANGVGALFSYNIGTNTYTDLYDFNTTNGTAPYGSLVEYLGNLYGMTSSGGTNGNGVIFQYSYSTSTYTKKHDFASATDGGAPYGTMVVAPNNKLYGVCASGGTGSYGTIFQYITGTNIFTNEYNLTYANGGNPYGDLILDNGKYYGLNAVGGANAHGCIFQFDYTTNAYANVYSMTVSNGNSPEGSLQLNPNGMLYGVSTQGGNSPENYINGDVYQFDAGTNAFAQKKIFEYSTNGKYPDGSTPVLASDNNYYGTTEYGGIDNYGVLYKFNLATKTYTKIFDFVKSTGSFPTGTIVQATDGKLYGTASQGGINDGGVIWKYDITGNTYTDVYDFPANSVPYGGLMEATNNLLYGTTESTSIGVYSFNFGTSVFTTLMSGTGSYCVPVQGNNSTLYGVFSGEATTSSEGSIWYWDFATTSGGIDYNFSYGTGEYPDGSLIIGTNGNLFGETSYGGLNSYGTFFEYDYVGNNYYDRHDFSGVDGQSPRYNTPFLASDGNIYGTTRLGGTNNSGVMFKWNYSTYSKEYDFLQTTGYYPTGTFNDITCCTGVDVISNTEEEQIQVYPNPFTSSINIENSTGDDCNASIYDVLGREVYSEKLKQGQNIIDAQTYSSGFYFIKVQTKNGLITKKLAKGN